jgi:hypothetical protein
VCVGQPSTGPPQQRTMTAGRAFPSELSLVSALPGRVTLP